MCSCNTDKYRKACQDDLFTLFWLLPHNEALLEGIIGNLHHIASSPQGQAVSILLEGKLLGFFLPGVEESASCVVFQPCTLGEQRESVIALCDADFVISLPLALGLS